jgi:hypothetical protein
MPAYDFNLAMTTVVPFRRQKCLPHTLRTLFSSQYFKGGYPI